jgi:hypothetical protein
MIPSYEVVPEIWLPDGTDCGYPTSDEISEEEGFGFFRGTWWIGRARVADARETFTFERDIAATLDLLANDLHEFEAFAKIVDELGPDNDDCPGLAGTPAEELVRPYLGDESPLHGLELGVAGLTYVLSAVGFRTAASCRAHPASGWTPYPVVLFGAHKWRAIVLSEYAAEAGCGIGQDRGMLSVYGPSIQNLMRLAEAVFVERARFKSAPSASRRLARKSEPPDQATLGL